MTSRADSRWGWVILALSTSFAAAASALAVANRVTAGPGVEGLMGPGAIAFIVGFLAFPLAGALIISRLPRHPIGWILCASGVLLEFSLVLAAYSERALLVEPGSLPGGVWVAWAGDWVAVGAIPLLASFGLLLFPDGRLPSPRWRPVAWVAGASIAGIVVFTALRPGLLDNRLADNPIGAAWAEPLGAFWVIFVSAALAAASSLVIRYRRSSGVERQQLRWIAAAGAVLALGFVSSAVLFTLIPPDAFEPSYLAGIYAGLLAMVGAIAVALLRHRLYELDLVVNRTLVYIALTAGVVAIYVGVVTGLGKLLDSTGLGVSLAAAGAVAALVIPLRAELQRRVDRLMYGHRDDPYRALTALAERLAEALEPDAVMPTIVEAVVDGLRLPYAAIELPEADGHRVAASHGEAGGGDLVRLELEHHGQRVGTLAVARRSPSEPLAAGDLRLLSDFAHQAAAAVHSVRLTDDLRRSRERLVGAREDERRRLRRDLHDGLGPALAGVALELEAARHVAARDPVAAGARLSRAKGEVQDAIVEIRRIARELLPVEGG